MVEQASRQDLSRPPAGTTIAARESLAAPAFLLYLPSSEKPGAISDPAFLCTFLI